MSASVDIYTVLYIHSKRHQRITGIFKRVEIHINRTKLCFMPDPPVWYFTQPAFTCSKSTMEIPEHYLKILSKLTIKTAERRH